MNAIGSSGAKLQLPPRLKNIPACMALNFRSASAAKTIRPS